MLFDAVVPGCTQKTQSFVLAPRAVSISLPVVELQEPELITGTTGFAQFTLPYGLELIPTLSYVYAVLGQPAYPESYGTAVSPSLTLTTEVLGQAVGPESIGLTLSPRLVTPYRIYTSVTETASASIGSLTPTNVSESASASTGTQSVNTVSETTSASTGTQSGNVVTETTSASIST